MRLPFLFTLLALGTFSTVGTAADKPDMVIFISDDHGQLDSTPYGSTDVRTPNMQKLADAGIRFTHAFVASPSCAPSRAAMLTGLMPSRNGAESNHTFKKDDVASLPETLRKLGYQTAAFGKVAHGAMDTLRHGFDHIGRKDTKVVAEFLAKRDRSKPVCLFVGTPHPHVPWSANDGYDPKKITPPPTFVDTPETRDFRCQYYTDVTKADTALGEIRDLARKELGKDTVFVYTSDHGAQWPFGKWNLYDSGIRIPLLIEWPGVVKPGTVSDAMVQMIDLLPTLIEIAGGTPPKDIDGRSYADILRGKTTTHREQIFTTHANDGDMNVYPIRSIRTRDWKFIRNLHPEWEHTTHIDKSDVSSSGIDYWKSWEKAATKDLAAAAIVRRYHERPKEELYDLKADPFEQHNLAADPKYAETLKGLSTKLDAWMKEQGDTGRVAGTPRLLPVKKE